MRILRELFQNEFKLDLYTVINSKAGSGNQRWHQGYRYLFDDTERLPTYSVVVGIPLTDVSLEQGNTQLCKEKLFRFYNGT